MTISQLAAGGPDEIRDEERTREAFQSVFRADDENAQVVLAWLANELGVFDEAPSMIRPECVAVWNRLLAQLGVHHELNRFTFAQAMMACANNNDLAEARRQVKELTDGSD